MASLRVERHPRGHIAACNGRLEIVNARVESCTTNYRPGNASENAQKFDTWARRERERKAYQLESFQRRVKHRVCQRERERQREIAAVSGELVKSEQRAAEKAVKLDRIKVPKSVEVGHDIEDVKVIAHAKATCVPQYPGRPTASQVARRSLLTKKVSEANTAEQTPCETVVVCDGTRPLASHDDAVTYQVVNQISEESVTTNEAAQPQIKDCHWSNNTELTTQSSFKLGIQSLRGPCSTLQKFTAPGQLEHAQKKQAAQQYHLFRKHYSDLERAQARQKQLQLTHNQRVEKLKRRKEADRRIIEDKANFSDSCSFLSTEAAEDQQRAIEWAELVAVESQRQQLQKAEETKRYIQALKARLKEQIESRKLDLPPLCACGLTLWDASPDTCANNCIFYRNPKAYAKALSALLVSLEL